jgi:hypothetical protein
MHQDNDIPFVDPRIEYVGASKLRSLNTSNLGKLKKTLVIQDNDTPLAVLLNYEQYLNMQGKLKEALETIHMLKQAPGVIDGLKDITAGKMTPLEQVDSTFK